MDACDCGAPAWCKKTSECKRCYFRRYRTEVRRARGIQPREEGRLFGCGHRVVGYTGHYRPKCDDCAGLTCKWDGCETAVGRARKWCDAHRRCMSAPDTLSRECADADCDRPVRARGVCNMHYKRILRSEGRMAPDPWSERKKANWHARRARKHEAFVESVSVDVVASRDGFSCGICKTRVDMSVQYPDPLSRSLDHVVPLALGGEHSYANTQLAHLACNVSKGARMVADSAVA